MQHTLSVLVNNKPGVLARVAGLFARRGFNIESLTVSQTNLPEVSRMTILVATDNGKDDGERVVEQITKQLNKLIDVIKVADYIGSDVVRRELALIKVKAGKNARGEIIQLCNIFRAQIVDVSEGSLMVQVAGESKKIDAFKGLLQPFGIKELVRSGEVILTRGAGLT